MLEGTVAPLKMAKPERSWCPFMISASLSPYFNKCDSATGSENSFLCSKEGYKKKFKTSLMWNLQISEINKSQVTVELGGK